MRSESGLNVLKGELIRDTVEGALYRILYISSDTKMGYWIRVDSSSNIPKSINLEDVRMRLNTRIYEAVIDSKDKDDVAKISLARQSERDRIWEQIKDIVTNEPAIYVRKTRGVLLHQQEKKTGVGIDKLYNYLGRFWRGGMTLDSLLPSYDKRGNCSTETVYTKRTGKPKQEGHNGKILTSEDKKKFEKAIKEYYSTDTKPTLSATYDWMIAHMYTKPRYKGDTDPEQLPPDEKPSYRQFTYWHAKNQKLVDEQKKREARRYDTTCRGATGRSDTFVKGPGMVAQIDATIADYYLVRENHRNEVIGRPVLFFVKDVKTRMIMGMYVTLENTSWDCALMALKNTVEDKVGFCKRYGVDISPEEWPCMHLPVSITADNGEMGDKGVEEIIARLGITVENTPPYRGDLKAIIENNFSMLDMKLRYIVPGHVDKDAGQRGSIDRRKEACIDINTFIQMIIRCVLYYNNYHYMETYDRTPDMIKHGIRAVPRNLWKYGMQFQSGALRIVSQEDIYKVLLPKDTASVTDRGIIFRELYYTCDKAKDELWFDKARMSGRWRIPITYDPTCLDHIYLSADDGSLIQCDLLSKSTMYQGFSEEDVEEIKKRDKQEQAQSKQEEEKARTNLILEMESLVERCKKEKKDSGVSAVNAVLDRHRLREQRQMEKEEQSGEASAREAQAELEGSTVPQSIYDTANDALDNAIDEALRNAGAFE
jgi:hypothetical protein